MDVCLSSAPVIMLFTVLDVAMYSTRDAESAYNSPAMNRDFTRSDKHTHKKMCQQNETGNDVPQNAAIKESNQIRKNSHPQKIIGSDVMSTPGVGGALMARSHSTLNLASSSASMTNESSSAFAMKSGLTHVSRCT